VDWESGIGNWYADNGVWQVGTPTASPAGCNTGTQCVGTVIDGSYDAFTDSRLISATTTLPAVTGNEEIHLRFYNWFNYGDYDSGQVQISVWDPITSTWGAWTDEGIAVSNSSVSNYSGGWTLKAVELTAYQGETVRLGFLHSAARSPSYTASEAPGWFIDDIEIVTSVPQFTGEFDAGIGDWYADNGVWQVGTPTSSPAGCNTGTQCVGTVIDGNYYAFTASRLISATTTLPTTTGAEEIHLRFYNWFNYGDYDSGQVQISVWDANTATWGIWTSEGIAVSSSSVSNYSGGWTLKAVELTAYQGETVRIGF
ncbi:MAG: hypothetical protein GY934_18190, partial [Gammaproteobacteria bacterium]|nr:hypothetical protein [Gammaproteobacteria bacterium]